MKLLPLQTYFCFQPLFQRCHRSSTSADISQNLSPLFSSKNRENYREYYGSHSEHIACHNVPVSVRMQHISSITNSRPVTFTLTAAHSEDGEITTSASHGSEFKRRCIEVEEKFSVSELDLNVLESKLSQMGFGKSGDDVEFMDWYFDLSEPNWVLSVSDNWLRYREILVDGDDNDKKRKGVWQLKCGKVIPSVENSAMTVYEELEGDEAFEVVMSMLPKLVESSKQKNNLKEETLMDGYVIPPLPVGVACDLVPFARIKTTRSSWMLQGKGDDTINSLSTLNVDIDCTDFGYLVGEVEQVVDNENDVGAAKRLVQKTIEQISGMSSVDVKNVLGKLELYMIRNRKRHFDECVKQGSMKTKHVL